MGLNSTCFPSTIFNVTLLCVCVCVCVCMCVCMCVGVLLARPVSSSACTCCTPAVPRLAVFLVCPRPECTVSSVCQCLLLCMYAVRLADLSPHASIFGS